MRGSECRPWEKVINWLVSKDATALMLLSRATQPQQYKDDAMVYHITG